MFAIATPQTVTLLTPGDDPQPIALTFHPAGDDTSRCIVDVLMPNGDVHLATFNVRGNLVDVQFVEHTAPEDEAPTESTDPQFAADAAEPEHHDGEEIQADEGADHPAGQAGEKQPA